MNASVIIPTHNREHVLSHVLQYYCLQDYPKDKFEVIVVDDGSVDGTPLLFTQLDEVKIDCSGAALRKYCDRIVKAVRGWYRPNTDETLFVAGEAVNIKYVRIKKSGRAMARNIGIRFSVFPLIIFADDDIFVESEFVKKHVGYHSDEDHAVIMGKVIHTQSIECPFDARWKLKDINTAFLATGNASVMKKYISQAGGFDENYTVYGWEDFDLGIHMSDIGLRSVKKRVYGYHYDPPKPFIEPEKIYRKEIERGISAVYFYSTHPLKWVKRFTLVDNRALDRIFSVLGFRNWFLKKKKISFLKGFFRLIIRYKGYFDGIREAKRMGISYERAGETRSEKTDAARR
jgi:glycosyltransferase involved in cell wall biosynthesis